LADHIHYILFIR